MLLGFREGRKITSQKESRILGSWSCKWSGPSSGSLLVTAQNSKLVLISYLSPWGLCFQNSKPTLTGLEIPPYTVLHLLPSQRQKGSQMSRGAVTTSLGRPEVWPGGLPGELETPSPSSAHLSLGRASSINSLFSGRCPAAPPSL